MSVQDSTTFKRCTKCGQEYPATTEYFHRAAYLKGGLRSDCKACVSARGRERYEQYQAAARRWKNEHREQVRANWLRWANEHREHLRAYSQQWRDEHREQHRENQRRWYWGNADHARASWRARYNKAAHAARERKRRARKVSVGGTHTPEDIERLYAAQKGHCYYCGSELNGVYHVDHYIPLILGGSNAADNLVLACPTCNLSKGGKLPGDWLRGKGKLL